MKATFIFDPKINRLKWCEGWPEKPSKTICEADCNCEIGDPCKMLPIEMEAYETAIRAKFPERPKLLPLSCDVDCDGYCGDVCPVIAGNRIHNETIKKDYDQAIQREAIANAIPLSEEANKLIQPILRQQCFQQPAKLIPFDLTLEGKMISRKICTCYGDNCDLGDECPYRKTVADFIPDEPNQKQLLTEMMKSSERLGHYGVPDEVKEPIEVPMTCIPLGVIFQVGVHKFIGLADNRGRNFSLNSVDENGNIGQVNEWQKCPVCDGVGYFNESGPNPKTGSFVISEMDGLCPTCNGHRIISKTTGTIFF